MSPALAWPRRVVHRVVAAGMATRFLELITSGSCGPRLAGRAVAVGLSVPGPVDGQGYPLADQGIFLARPHTRSATVPERKAS
jgi:hypothetical protein